MDRNEGEINRGWQPQALYSRLMGCQWQGGGSSGATIATGGYNSFFTQVAKHLVSDAGHLGRQPAQVAGQWMHPALLGQRDGKTESEQLSKVGKR